MVRKLNLIINLLETIAIYGQVGKGILAQASHEPYVNPSIHTALLTYLNFSVLPFTVHFEH
jgi:hypothetical protein